MTPGKLLGLAKIGLAQIRTLGVILRTASIPGPMSSQKHLGSTATMICQRCNRLLSNRSLTSPYLRAFTTAAARSKPESPPPATSTSGAQPYSTPFTPSPSNTPGIPPKDKPEQLKNVPRSSVPAGAPLRGLGYVKGQEAPLAREDDEYPNWLWGLLSAGQEEKDSSGPMGDAFGEHIVYSLPQLAPEQGKAQRDFQKMASEVWAITSLVTV